MHEVYPIVKSQLSTQQRFYPWFYHTDTYLLYSIYLIWLMMCFPFSACTCFRVTGWSSERGKPSSGCWLWKWLPCGMHGRHGNTTFRFLHLAFVSTGNIKVQAIYRIFQCHSLLLMQRMKNNLPDYAHYAGSQFTQLAWNFYVF